MKAIRGVLVLIIFISMIFLVTGAVSATDTTPPTVISVDPFNNSVNVVGDKVISVTFSEALQKGTDWTELKGNNNSTIPTTNTINGNVLTITHSKLLMNGTKYILTLHSGCYKDLAGNPVSLYTTSFTVSKTNPTFSGVYLREIQSDKIINGKYYYAQYAIYQKPTNSTSWTRYLFNHIVNAPEAGVNGPENVYCIYKLQNVVLGTNTNYFPYSLSSEDLTEPGNWEKALQLSGTPLIGGMHGYELYIGIKFYENGKQITPNTINPVTNCNDLQIVETSNLINPNNLSQVIATTTTTYDWNGQNLRLHTVYNWKINATVTTAYAAMFPSLNKTFNMGQIKGLPAENFLTRTTELRGNSAEATIWNNVTNLHISIEILNPLIALNNYLNNGNVTNGETYIRTLGNYNKLYITRVNTPGYETVNNTTIWDIETRYTIWNGQN